MMYGRELLKAGLIWRVGDGTQISAWRDNWIPRSGSLYPLGRDPDDELDKVAALLLSDGGGWDIVKLRNHFSEVDVSDIL
jgi:hypothetical protein